MSAPLITTREFNRATLARQWLLQREEAAPLEAIERLIGLQAQEARPPYIGLWSRLKGFEREDLAQVLLSREVVRATAMRGTLHLMTARDYIAFRSTLQPMLTAGMQSILRSRTVGLDIAGAVGTARDFFGASHATFDDLRNLLLTNDPECDERAMAYAVRTHLPLVQVPDGSAWSYPSAAKFAPAEAWLGVPISEEEKMDALMIRYLSAFGPASATDAQTWLGAGGLANVFHGLREQLVVFKDERGRELFDLPDAPRPGADTPAQVRFLPDYDNLLLAHSDRRRVIADSHRKQVVTANLRVLATFLVDGFVAGIWKIERKKSRASLILQPFAALAENDRNELVEEGKKLLSFVEEDAELTQISFESPSGESA